MTDTQREAFEAYFLDSRKSKHKPNFARLEDGTYADDHTQRHWWTWQQAALTQPQAQQAKTGHDSDCSLHNEPAYPAGPCDCSQQAAAVPASPAKGSIELARSLCVDIAGPPDAAGDDTSGYGYGSVDVAEILSAEVVRLKALLSSAPAAPQAQGWLPIESAPRDGRVVLVGRHMGDFGFIRGYARFEGGDSFVSGWVSNGFDEVMGNLGLGHPTHWQPLPAPPVGITVGEGG